MSDSLADYRGKHRIRLTPGGRVVIPAEVRRDLGVAEGEELVLTRDGDGYRLTTHRAAIRRAQELFARARTPGESVVDELLRERREEAEREEREFAELQNRK